jgi:UDP-MurNAc hydroxylase
LDPDLFHHNDEMQDGIFPDQEQVAAWLLERGIENTVVLLPGDSWDLLDRHRERDTHWMVHDLKDRTTYLTEYAKRREPHLTAVLNRYPPPERPLWPEFQDYFEDLLGLSVYFNRKIGMKVGFDIQGVGGGQWSVDFRPASQGVYRDISDCAYRYHFESRWLPCLLSGRVPWEDFFLSLRFRVSRNPDIYNDHLLGLLKFAEEEPLDAVEGYETSLNIDERIVLHAEGRAYRVQRRCPHAGQDLLETGEILPGRILRCLAHHYEFSLDTGECVNGSCSRLSTELLE